MQADHRLVNSFVNDMARVATLQYTKSVGQVRAWNWLDIKARAPYLCRTSRTRT